MRQFAFDTKGPAQSTAGASSTKSAAEIRVKHGLVCSTVRCRADKPIQGISAPRTNLVCSAVRCRANKPIQGFFAPRTNLKLDYTLLGIACTCVRLPCPPSMRCGGPATAVGVKCGIFCICSGENAENSTLYPRSSRRSKRLRMVQRRDRRMSNMPVVRRDWHGKETGVV